jgi:hypothetical protein
MNKHNPFSLLGTCNKQILPQRFKIGQHDCKLFFSTMEKGIVSVHYPTRLCPIGMFGYKPIFGDGDYLIEFQFCSKLVMFNPS